MGPIRDTSAPDTVSTERASIRGEFELAQRTLHDLVRTAGADDLDRPSDGTRWTNRQLLFHMVFGYLVVRTLLPMVKMISRLPASVGRAFAATLNAATGPFNFVNYWGSVIGARIYPEGRLLRKLDAVVACLEHRLQAEDSETMQRSMAFPVRWDPFFKTSMTVADVYRYPTHHFTFHQRQLTLARPTEEDDMTDDTKIHKAVQAHYAKAAQSVETCCGPTGAADELIGRSLYRDDDSSTLPEGALAASLGCGNPTLLADLGPGEVVLDLGSGGGIDVLLSARRVVPGGKAYGLDMTPEMLELARRNQVEAGVSNAEFLEGTIEAIPLPEEEVDVIISNCVVNLSPDKPAVLREAFRVLRPGGRLAISDIVLRRPLSNELRSVIGLWTGCVAGALLDGDYRDELKRAGFEAIEVEPTQVYGREDLRQMAGDIPAIAALPDNFDIETTLSGLDGAVMSAFVRARKPAAAGKRTGA